MESRHQADDHAGHRPYRRNINIMKPTSTIIITLAILLTASCNREKQVIDENAEATKDAIENRQDDLDAAADLEKARIDAAEDAAQAQLEADKKKADAAADAEKARIDAIEQ